MKNETSFGKIAEKISAGLKKAQKEIEEFALQASLGKAEAGDKFEELKGEFREKAGEWKQFFSNLKSSNQEKADKLKSQLDELQLQLSLGKADAKDYFFEQRKKILNALHELESGLNDNPELNERMNEFKSEIEKFKLKLNILELQFELKAFKGKEKMKEAMDVAGIEIDKLLMKAELQWDEAKKKSGDFTKEIAAAFEHLKKAIASLKDKS